MSDSRQEQFSTVMIDLDSLLDTRLAAFSSFPEDVLEKVMKNNYWDRTSDTFKDVDNEQYQSVYKNRKKSILGSALVTPMLSFLKEYCYMTIENSQSTPFKMIPRVLVNTYPYKLEEKEKDIISSTISAGILDLAEVKVVYMDHESLNPSFVKSSLSTLIMYHYDQWLEYHCQKETFKSRTCPEVTLIGPKISMKTLKENETVTEENFEAMRILAGPLINLVLLPIEHFSVIRAKKKT